MAWRLLSHHLAALTTEACLWRPGRDRGLHVYQDEDRRKWRADWPKTEGYDIGPPSLAWQSWHLIFWWSMVIDHSFGDASLTREQVLWPGTAEGVRVEVSALHAQWVEKVEALEDDALMGTGLTHWPFRSRPFVDVIAWANTELTKSASEMGYVLFLRG